MNLWQNTMQFKEMTQNMHNTQNAIINFTNTHGIIEINDKLYEFYWKKTYLYECINEFSNKDEISFWMYLSQCKYKKNETKCLISHEIMNF
jgi:hypothetical protein